MFRWLDTLSNILLRFAYDSMKVFLLFVMLARAFQEDFDMTGLYGFTAAMFILSAAVNGFLTTLSDEQRDRMRLVGMGGMAVSLAMGMGLYSFYGFTGRMIMAIYFMVVWLNGLRFVTERDNTRLFFKRFFQTILVMSVISMSVGIGQLRWYMSELQPFFTVFFLSVVMNLISMNLKAAYREEAANIMQKNRRVVAFNVVSIVVLTASILGLVALFSSVSLGWAENILRFALMPIGQLGSWISSRIKARALRNRGQSGGGTQSVGDAISEMREDLAEEFPLSTESPWDQYVEWAFVLIVAVLVIGLVYYMTRQLERRHRRVGEPESTEVRESLISGEYLRRHIRQKLRAAGQRLGSLLGTKSEALSLERATFKMYMQYLAGQGVLITEDMTPNEILAQDRLKRGLREDAKTLTDIYNRSRYGQMIPDDQELVFLEKYAKSMDTDDV